MQIPQKVESILSNPTPSRLKPPLHLGPDGKELWEDVARQYAIADSAGLALLTTAAESLDRIRAAQAAVAKDGVMVPDRYGAPKLHPALALEARSRAALLAALKALHLDLEPLKAIGRPSTK